MVAIEDVLGGSGFGSDERGNAKLLDFSVMMLWQITLHSMIFLKPTVRKSNNN